MTITLVLTVTLPGPHGLDHIDLAVDAGSAVRGRVPTAVTESVPSGLTADDWTQIRRLHQESEYHATRFARPSQRSAFQAPNKRQGYRTTFRRGGIEIASHTPAGPAWRLDVLVTGYGYERDVHHLPPADPRAHEERVEYRRGPVTEWYVNRPRGLEQGFELQEPPARRARSLIVTMAVQGDLSVSPWGDGIALVDRSGKTIVHYADLKAWDAEGRALTSRMEAAGGKVRLVVDAQTARFPVTVDPIFVHEAQLFGRTDPVAQSGARAGSAVAVSGDTVVVGASLYDWPTGSNAGSADVFVRSGTTWALQQRLRASDGAANDNFGVSVSISGETIVVGAIGNQFPGAPVEPGFAYVFVRSGTTWSEQQKLLASDGAANELFGFSLSLSGDTLVVGAPRHDTPTGVDAGSAYVFVRSGTTWSEQQKLAAPDGAADDEFGYSVAVAVDTLVVGAQLDDTPAGGNAGSAYVFVRSGTTWSQQQKLTASDGEANDYFGFSVSISGDTVVAGAEFGDTPSGVDAGSAYVFVRSGTTWSEQQKLTPSDGAASDRFGHAVSLSGDTVVVGARTDDTAGGGDAGSAYVFVRSGTTWSEQQKLTASDGAANDFFGSSVSAFGDTVVIGAPEDDSPNVDAGSAYMFFRSGVTWIEQQKLVGSDDTAGDSFGYSVSVFGDTAVVGAPNDRTLTSLPTGSAYVFIRTGTIWTEQQKLVPSDGSINDNYFGASVSLAGDTVVIGEPLDDNRGGVDAGAAYVFVRSGTIWTEQQKLQASDGAYYDRFGTSVSVSADTIVAGAPLHNVPGGENAGSAYVFVRSGTTWTEQQELLAADPGASDAIGASVSVSGDTVVVGAPSSAMPGGVAYVFVRAGTTWTEQQKLLATDGAGGDLFGGSVSLSGDTVVLGAALAETPSGADAGAAYVFVRSGTTWTEQQKLLAPDGGTADSFGFSVSVSAGTVVAGAPLDDTPVGGVNAGSAHIFRGEVFADLVMTKTDGQATAVPGQTLTYTIVASNAGPNGVIGATVVDGLPAALQGATWTCMASPGSTCATSGSGNINDTVNLLVGGTATYTVVGILDPAATGVLSNTATVTSPGAPPDPNPANNSGTDTDTLTPEADLAIIKTDSADPVSPGAPLSYLLAIANVGPSNSTSVTVIDTLPAGVTFVSSSPGAPTCNFGGATLTCALGPLAADGNMLVTINTTVNASASGMLMNTATVSGSETDPDPANNSDTAATAVGSRDGELAHGTDALYDLAAQPGPVADADIFRINQKPFSSYEVVVDATSGDIGSGAGPFLDRLGADGTTVLQLSVPVGAGSTRSLRWRNTTSSEEEGQTIRVRSAGCGTDCGPDDVYRIRAYETTYSGARFNNTGTQVTVLILQNPTDYPISGEAYFRIPSGSPVASEAFSLSPKATLVLNTSTVQGADGVSGAITVSHNGRYGDLAGKTVALEPATGFSFDSPLEPRPN